MNTIAYIYVYMSVHSLHMATMATIRHGIFLDPGKDQHIILQIGERKNKSINTSMFHVKDRKSTSKNKH